MATTSKDNWIVGVHALHGNPYDGHTLKGALEQVERITGWAAANAYSDRGYRGVPSTVGATTVLVGTPRRRSTPRAAWRWLKRRAAVEPVIGHLKGITGWTETRASARMGTASMRSWRRAGTI